MTSIQAYRKTSLQILPIKKRLDKSAVKIRKKTRSKRNVRRNFPAVSSQGCKKINRNIFFLLASHGKHVKGTWRKNKYGSEWSSQKNWFMVDICKNGFPWKLESMTDIQTLTTFCFQSKDSHSFEYHGSSGNEKSCSHNDILSAYWNTFVSFKFEALHLRGFAVLKSYMETYSSFDGETAAIPHQSLTWYKNSCALDSVMAVLPHLCVRIIQNGIYNEKILGSNALYHSPVASVLVSTWSLRNSKKPALVSNWARHLFLALLKHNNIRGTSETGLDWSCFKKSNDFLDIAECLWAIDVLLGSGNRRFQKTKHLHFAEIPSQVGFQTFTEVEQQNASRDLSLAQFLYHCLRSCSFVTENGVYAMWIHTSEGSSTLYSDWLYEKLKSPWRGEFRPADGSAEWSVELVALIGPTPTSQNHFHSIACHYYQEQHFEIFDGMVGNGKSRELRVSNMGHLISLHHIFLLFTVRLDFSKN